jgi:hypothetical protein
MIIGFYWFSLTENSSEMAIESLVRKKYFLTSEQSECFVSLSIEAANVLYIKFFKSVFNSILYH